jgi:hypothetical protein
MILTRLILSPLHGEFHESIRLFVNGIVFGYF